jgi:pimeloyl-ACP methyl ester carboxylesterase
MPIAQLNGARIAFDDSGAPPADLAGMPLVLVHAGIADRTMWDHQVAAFVPAHRVVRLDQRGFGESDSPPEPFAPGEDIRALMDHLAIDRAVVVGVSMGGDAVLDLALAHPDRVAGLVLCSTLAAKREEPGPELVAIWEDADAAFEAGDLDRAVEIETAGWVDGRGRPPGTLAPEARAQAVAMIRRTWERADDQPGERLPLDPPSPTRLGDVTVPTLVLRGDLDVPDVTTSTDRLVAGIPRRRLRPDPERRPPPTPRAARRLQRPPPRLARHRRLRAGGRGPGAGGRGPGAGGRDERATPIVAGIHR